MIVTSQLPLEHIEEYLFGTPQGWREKGEGNLPDMEQFKLVSIVYDGEENEKKVEGEEKMTA